MTHDRLRRPDPYLAEITTALCSCWAARCLSLGADALPGPISAYYRLMLRLDGREQSWALLIGCSGLLVLAGLAVTPIRHLHLVAAGLRIAGLAMAGAFFVTVALSYFQTNKASLSAFPLLMVGLTAWWLLFRGLPFPAPVR